MSLLNCVPRVLKTCSRALRAYILKCLACLRATLPCMLTCSYANVPCVLTCSPANVLCLLTSSRANVPCALTGNLSCMLTYRKYQHVFFRVKLTFWHALYWDEKNLKKPVKVASRRVTRRGSQRSRPEEVEARSVTRNASKHNEMGFVISLNNDRCGSRQTHRKQFFAKIVNSFMQIYYFLKILHIIWQLCKSASGFSY